MASDVQVHVTDQAIISALNTPGGAVYEWRDDAAEAITNSAIALSPVNDIQNALHRMGVTGTYKAAWAFQRLGNQHRVQAVIFNGSDHADIVEFGRHRSFKREVFSWTGHDPPGSTNEHRRGTRGRRGQHVLQRSVNMRGQSTGDWLPMATPS